MRVFLIDNGKVVGEFYGLTAEELMANNPGMVFVKSLSGINQVIGMDYANGVLSGIPTPEPVPQPVIPQLVTMRQARLALMGAGKLASINAAIAGMPGVQGDAARIEWEFSSEVKRSQPLVLSMGQALGLTAAQLDALFIAASAL